MSRNQYVYNSLFGTSSTTSEYISVGLLNLPNLTKNTVAYIDSTNNLNNLNAMLNGQIIIGSTGNAPVVGNLNVTANLIETKGAGTLQLDTVQGIQTSSSPTFVGLNLSGLTASEPVLTDASKNLISGQINLASASYVTGILGILNGGTGTSTPSLIQGSNINITGSFPNQTINVVSAPSFSGTVTVGNLIDSGLTISLPVHTDASNQLISGLISLTSDVTGILPVLNGGTGTSTPSLVPGSNISITGSFPNQTINVGSAPSFSGTVTVANLIDSGLTATRLVATNASSQLQSVTITNANGTNFSFSGSTLACTMNQNLAVGGSPTFANLTDSGLTASMPVKSNGSKTLVSSLININTDTTGFPLTVANGGTNNTSLTGNYLMKSTSTSIVEANTTSDNLTVNGNLTFSATSTPILVSVPDVSLSNSISVVRAGNTLSYGTQMLMKADKTHNWTFGTDYSQTKKDDFYFFSNVASGAVLRLNYDVIANAFTNFAVSTNTNTLDDGSGKATFAQIVDTGVTSALICANSSHLLNNVTISNSNGSSMSFSGTTLTASLSQNLSSAGSPTFTNLFLSGLLQDKLVATNVAKELVSIDFSNSNGCAFGVTPPNITASMTQNLDVTGSPIFNGLTIDNSTEAILYLNTTAVTGTVPVIYQLNGVNKFATSWDSSIGFSLTDSTAGQWLYQNGTSTNNVQTFNSTLDNGSGYMTINAGGVGSNTGLTVNVGNSGGAFIRCNYNSSTTNSAAFGQGGTGIGVSIFDYSNSGYYWLTQNGTTKGNIQTLNNILDDGLGTMILVGQSSGDHDPILKLRRGTYANKYISRIRFVDDNPGTVYWENGTDINGNKGKDMYWYQQGGSGLGKCLYIDGVKGFVGCGYNYLFPTTVATQNTHTFTIAEILGGICTPNVPVAGFTWQFDTQTNIYTGMGSPAVGTTVTCLFSNSSNTQTGTFDFTNAGHVSGMLRGNSLPPNSSIIVYFRVTGVNTVSVYG